MLSQCFLLWLFPNFNPFQLTLCISASVLPSRLPELHAVYLCKIQGNTRTINKIQRSARKHPARVQLKYLSNPSTHLARNPVDQKKARIPLPIAPPAQTPASPRVAHSVHDSPRRRAAYPRGPHACRQRVEPAVVVRHHQETIKFPVDSTYF